MGNDKILTTEKGFQLLNEMAQMRVNLKKIIKKYKRLEKKSNQLIPKKLFKGCFNNKLEKYKEEYSDLEQQVQQQETEFDEYTNAYSLRERFGTINELNRYKGCCKKKRNRIFVISLHIIALLICTIVFILVLFSDFNNGVCPLMIHSLKRGICILFILLLVFSIAVYSLFYTIKKYRLYNNAIHKLDLLIMRLKIDSEKNLVVPYRLDRELEMIYRILES